jgi:hypothetical protein
MSTEPKVRFPLLAEQNYDPNTFLYTNTQENGMPKLADWIEVFRSSVPSFQKMAENDKSVDAAERASKAAKFATRCAAFGFPSSKRELVMAHSVIRSISNHLEYVFFPSTYFCWLASMVTLSSLHQWAPRVKIAGTRFLTAEAGNVGIMPS